MILVIMAGLAATAQAGQQAPTPADDIVVIGERLRQLRIVTRKNHRTGTTRCSIKPSSGDLLLDTGVCDAYLHCVPKVDTAAALEACMKPPLVELVGKWIERRKGVSTGTMR